MSKRAPKWWRYLRAKLGGYFWLPCDVCGEPFGGHELYGTVQLTATRGRGICVLCAVERQQCAEEARFKGWPSVRFHNGRTVHEVPYKLDTMDHTLIARTGRWPSYLSERDPPIHSHGGENASNG